MAGYNNLPGLLSTRALVQAHIFLNSRFQKKVTGVSMSNTCLPQAHPANLRRDRYTRVTVRAVRARDVASGSLLSSSSVQAERAGRFRHRNRLGTVCSRLGSGDLTEISTLRPAALELIGTLGSWIYTRGAEWTAGAEERRLAIWRRLCFGLHTSVTPTGLTSDRTSHECA